MNNLFELSPQPMWIYDAHTLCFLDVNKAAVLHYGYSKAEFLQLTLKEIALEEEPDVIYEVGEISGNQQLNYAKRLNRHLKKNGEIIDVQVQSNPIQFNGGAAELILITDITAIIQAERQLKASKEELLKSEKRFKAMVQEGSDVIAIIDLAGNYQFVSESALVVLGYEASDVQGRNVFEFIHPEDKGRVENTLASLLKLKRVSIESFRFLNAANQWRWLSTTATNLLDDPAVGGIVTNSKDITEATLKREELRLSIERYRLVLKASDEAVCDWDIVNDVVVWGIGFHEIFGYDLSVYNNTIWSANIHPDDKEWVEEELDKAIHNPDTEILLSEYRFLKANREVVVVQYRALFLRNEEGKAIRAVGSFRDVTANKETLDKIKKQNEKLKEIAWAQSHKVRGPLARIMALTSLLEDEDCLSENQKELLSHLSVSAAELDQAIRIIIKTAESLEANRD